MKQNKTKESGRSMVEMLGVLAVIGVLSVTGIYGYRQAMAQYKANELWNNILLWAQIIRGIPNYNATHLKERAEIINFSNFKNIGGYDMTVKLLPVQGHDRVFGGAFFIKVSDVPKDVCEKVLHMRPDDFVGLDPNNNSSNYQRDNECVNDKSTILFTFDKPLVCSNLCDKWYRYWKENCGGNKLPLCDPKMGFLCRLSKVNDTERCEHSNFRYHCYGNYFYTNPSQKGWLTNGFKANDMASNTEYVCPN